MRPEFADWETISRLLPSPRDRRLIERLVSDLRRHRVALLLGAGADLQLSNALNWVDLVRSLFPAGSEPPREWVSAWPTEFAATARQYLGDESYFRKMEQGTGRIPRDGEWSVALEALAEHVPLVVTTNYSHWTARALAAGREVVIVERSSLRSARLPEPGVPFHNLTVVHIHGRLKLGGGQGERSDPVLDKFSYDEAEHGDLLYRDFLTQLFERWTVLVMGSSFSDVPLRSAASLAQTRRPELRKQHVWMDLGGTQSPQKWRSRASFLCYSVARVEVASDHRVVGTLAAAVARAAPPEIKTSRAAVLDGDFGQLADLLDRAGDYEAIHQQRLFQDPELTLQLCRGLLASSSPLPVLARIERHLRHHLYFVKPESESRALRRQLWGRVADLVEAGSDVQAAIRDDPRLHFDVLVGGMEVGDHDRRHRLESVLGAPRDRLLGERLELARRVWPGGARKDDGEPLSDLRRRAATLGWESIESKLAWNEAWHEAAEALREPSVRVSPRRVSRVLRACGVSIRAAQYAGTLQRELGSYILKSLWTQSDVESRAVLHAAVTLAREADALSPTIAAAIAMAWVNTFESADEAFQEVGWRSPPPPEDREEQRKWWSKVTPPKA